MSLRIRLLGVVEVLRDGRPVPLRALKRIALLVALALNCNQPVSLDDLTDAVWTDDPPRSAIANLRNYAGALRQAVGDRIASCAGGYRLTLREGELDVAEFRGLATAGRQALAAGRGGRAAELLTGALNLWHGPVAGGLPAGGTVGVELADLDRQRVTTFGDLVQARLELGQHADVVPGLRAHLHQHPLDERCWAHLMLALYRVGDVAGALAAYTGARTLIREDLGIEPGSRLVALHHAMLNRSPELDPYPAVPSRPRDVVAGRPDPTPATLAYHRKLARYRAALDAGADPAVIATWISQAKAEHQPSPDRASAYVGAHPRRD